MMTRREELECALTQGFPDVGIKGEETTTGYVFLDIVIGPRGFVVSFGPYDPRYGLLALPDKGLSGADEVYNSPAEIVARVQYLIDHNERTRPPY